MFNRKLEPGFTLVELLIAIVVIAVLASISAVAYAGITDRAHSAVVQNDLAGLAKTLQLIYIETGSYPRGGDYADAPGSWTGHPAYTPPDGLSFDITESSYYIPPDGGGRANLIYCTGANATTGQPEFGIVATTVTGTSYRHSTVEGNQEVSGISDSIACSGITYPMSISYGYWSNEGDWMPWTK